MKKKIFLGTKNPAKIEKYRNLISGYTLVTPIDLGIDIDVAENNFSLQENSEKKAREWAKLSGFPTISEDTGFFVPALGGKPGVSVKTWGGEVEQMSAEDFLPFVREKFLPLEDRSCYFETALSLGFPDGTVISIGTKIDGYIDIDRFENASSLGYPLSAVFVANTGGKTYQERSEAEKRELHTNFIEKLQILLKEYDYKIV